jgi:hypothetical protein
MVDAIIIAIADIIIVVQNHSFRHSDFPKLMNYSLKLEDQPSPDFVEIYLLYSL